MDVLGCVPDCTSGSSTPTPVTLHLSHPFDGIFTVLLEEIQGAAPLTLALPTTEDL